MAVIKANYQIIQKAAQQAFVDSMELLGSQGFDRAISDNIWDWPNATLRYGKGNRKKRPKKRPKSAPTEAGSTRNIVDFGQLRSSQKLIIIKPGLARFVWATEYAIYVHEGVTLRNGRQLPGRPWTQKGLELYDWQAAFEKLLLAELGR